MVGQPWCRIKKLVRLGLRHKKNRCVSATCRHHRFEFLEPRRLLALTNADFNGDHFVDDSDLSAWQQEYGITSGATYDQGDANRDGAVDGLDFLAWQRGAGQPAVTVDVTLTNADFNGDHSVSAQDLAVWQQGFGSAVQATRDQGDAEGDRDVDGFDFLNWQWNFGLTSPDPLGILTIDDTQSWLDEIVVTAVDEGGIDVVAVNGRPTDVASDQVERIEVLGGYGNDIIDLSAVDSTHFHALLDGQIRIDGGAGDDVITGSSLSQTILGNFGDDRLAGGSGHDTLSGGGGDDLYVFAGQEGLGSDAILELGGAGIDTLDFTELLIGTGITLDLGNTLSPQQLGVFNGKSLWLDLTQSPEIENVIGSAFDDVILGNALDNILRGGAGGDTLRGSDGEDIVSGEAGDDFVYGDGGDDSIRGGEGSDYGEGGAGKDQSDLDRTNDPSDEDTSKPELETMEAIRVRKDVQRKIRILAEDGDHLYEDLQFTLASVSGTPLPSDASLGSDGTFTWSTRVSSADQIPGTYQVEVTVTDPDGHSDSQVLTIEDYDYNEAAPEFKTYHSWIDDQAPAPGAVPHDFSHAHFSDTGGTGVHKDVVGLTLSDLAELGYQSSATLHLQLNPSATNLFEYDTQTSQADLVYELIDGPGSLTADGLYTWDVGSGDAGTYRVVFEVSDTGSPDNGEVRTTEDYLFVEVDAYFADTSGTYLRDWEPVAIDRAYALDVDETIQHSIYTGPQTGVYNPIFNKFINGFGADYFSRFTLGNASHGTVELVTGQPADQWNGYTRAEQWGEFTYIPVDDYRGLDSFTYTIEHYIGDPYEPIDEDLWRTSNEGTVNLHVGQRVIVDLDTSLADEIERDAPGELMYWNVDDDNDNNIEDYKELDGPVVGEDDLVKISIDNWFREDYYLPDIVFEFYSGAPRLWDSPTKNHEISYQDQFLISELPEEVWAEAVNPISDLVVFRIVKTGNVPGPSLAGESSDRVRMSPYAIDLDIDSDNNNVIAGSAWEEELEDHQYGLGKLVLQNYGTDDAGENAPNFTPLVIRLSPGLIPDDPQLRIRIDYDPAGTAGYIDLWRTTKNVIDPYLNEQGVPLVPGQPGDAANGGLRISSGGVYKLSDLNYDSQVGGIVLWISGRQEDVLRKTLKGVEDYGKLDETITATMMYDGVDIDFDEVKYRVTQPDSFFYHLQTRREVRTGLASGEVYNDIDDRDLPKFSLRELKEPDLAKLEIDDLSKLLLTEHVIEGFGATLYQDYIAGGPTQFVLAFAGTNPADIADWVANFIQGSFYLQAVLELQSEQYQAAMYLGGKLLDSKYISTTNLVTTGHSLGGGLASAASVAGGLPADTFNATGLNFLTFFIPNMQNPNIYPEALPNYFSSSERIRAYYVDWDILSLLQDYSFIALPSALGYRIQMDGPYDLELTTVTAISAIIASANPYAGLAAFLAGDGYFMVLAHLQPAFLHGLLVDLSGDDILGYDL